MATPTFTKVATNTISSSGISSITFSSIPSAYQDLLIYMSVDVDRTGNYSLNNFTQVNSQSTTTNYVGGYLYNDASTANSSTSSPSVFPSSANGGEASTFSTNWLYIPAYRSTTLSNMIYYMGAGNNIGNTYGVILFGNARPGTAEAINSITLKEISGNSYVTGTTFYLYGIKSS